MDLQDLTIMVVEDEVIISILLQRLLERLGCKVIAPVISGEDAVRLAAEKHPDLLLMDIRLAGQMDGLEAVRQIRLTDDIPVVFMTAYNSKLIQTLIADFHPVAFLEKPISNSTLEWIIRHFAEGKTDVASPD